MARGASPHPRGLPAAGQRPGGAAGSSLVPRPAQPAAGGRHRDADALRPDPEQAASAACGARARRLRRRRPRRCAPASPREAEAPRGRSSLRGRSPAPRFVPGRRAGGGRRPGRRARPAARAKRLCVPRPPRASTPSGVRSSSRKGGSWHEPFHGVRLGASSWRPGSRRRLPWRSLRWLPRTLRRTPRRLRFRPGRPAPGAADRHARGGRDPRRVTLGALQPGRARVPRLRPRGRAGRWLPRAGPERGLRSMISSVRSCV